jgi:hypothetical protein
VRHEVLPRRGLLSNASGNELSIALHRDGSIRWVEVVEKRDGIEPRRNRNQACRCAVAARDPLSRASIIRREPEPRWLGGQVYNFVANTSTRIITA